MIFPPKTTPRPWNCLCGCDDQTKHPHWVYCNTLIGPRKPCSSGTQVGPGRLGQVIMGVCFISERRLAVVLLNTSIMPAATSASAFLMEAQTQFETCRFSPLGLLVRALWYNYTNTVTTSLGVLFHSFTLRTAEEICKRFTARLTASPGAGDKTGIPTGLFYTIIVGFWADLRITLTW